MILKVRSKDGWVVVPGLKQAEYGGPRGEKMGFYVNKTKPEYPVHVVVERHDLNGEELYYPHNDALIMRATDCCGVPKEVQVHGRSSLESEFLDALLDEVHAEDVVFMAWIRDYETGEVRLFDEAFILNDNGKTIERIY